MRSKRFLIPAAAVVLLVLFTGVVLAQGNVPPVQSTAPAPGATVAPRSAAPGAQQAPRLPNFGVPNGGWKVFDAVAGALKLTPAQLFDQLHSGKRVPEIAQGQGVDMASVLQAANKARLDAAHQAIANAQQNGKITQDQANWLTQGLDNGWFRGALKAFLRARVRR